MKQQVNVKGYSRRAPNASEQLATQIALLNSHEVAANRFQRLNRTMSEILACGLEADLASTDFTEGKQ